jgi:competence protein ComEC
MTAAYYGRRAKPLLLIALVAAVTAYINPIYVWSDAGWYLSFLAFYGVLMVSPLLQKRLPPVFGRSIILSVGLESICAEIMSVPYILYTFGEMSFMGLPANVLVVTLIPLAMLLGFIAGLAGMLLPALCGWFAWPAKLVFIYMLDTAHVLASVPHAATNNKTLSLPGLVMLYGVIVTLSGLLAFKDRSKSAIITDKNILDTS